MIINSIGQKLNSAFGKKYWIFWSVVGYWGTLAMAAILWFIANNTVQKLDTSFNIAYHYNLALQFKDYAFIFIPICIGHFLFFYIKKEGAFLGSVVKFSN